MLKLKLDMLLQNKPMENGLTKFYEQVKENL